MVMLSAIAGGSTPDGEQMFEFGRSRLPSSLSFGSSWASLPSHSSSGSVRKLINSETLLDRVPRTLLRHGGAVHQGRDSPVLSVLSSWAASLAETIEAEKIIKLVEPVKNLFGAIFFVSVGMLVDPRDPGRTMPCLSLPSCSPS